MRSEIKRLAGLIIASGFLFMAVLAFADNVGITSHNLSSGGPGLWGSTDETEVCVFCHTPHGASAEGPLWNRSVPSGVTFSTYGSDTLVSTPFQPGPESLLCLSCHDGVTALNALINPSPTQPIMSGGTIGDQIGDMYYPGSPYGTVMNIGGSYPGNPNVNELGDDHPVSFIFNSALVSGKPGLQLPDAASPIQLRGFASDRVECTTCHNPHDNTYGAFLVMSNENSDMCLTCHTK